MNEISRSIWQQNEIGEWKLYFNSDLEINNSSSNNNNLDQEKIRKNNYLENNLFLGTLVMTQKGIGRLIKNNEKMGIIRFRQDIEVQFPINEVSNYFTCFIYDYSNNLNIIRLKLKVLGKIDDVINELEKIKK